MDDLGKENRAPRWLLIGTAVCVAIPDLILLHQLTPAFQASHRLHPDIRAMSDSPATIHVAMIIAELMRPAVSLFVAWGVLGQQRLTFAIVYLALRIAAPLLLALRAPRVVDWPFAFILLHVLALAGVIYLRRFQDPKPADVTR